MKHVKMFGKSVPLIAIVLAGMLTIGASAYLATYLSNTVTAEVTVTSPMRVGVSLGGLEWGGDSYPQDDHDLADWTTGTLTLDIPDVSGGETLTLYLMSENLADAEITGFEEVIVSNPEGITCADFTSVKVWVDSIYGDLGYGSENDALLICVQNDDDLNSVKFDSTIIDDLETPEIEGLSTWGAGETDVTKIEVTFNTAAAGTYTITYQIVPLTP